MVKEDGGKTINICSSSVSFVDVDEGIEILR
jgi:hypothetical protein